jgi:uncharacterized protein
MAYDKRYLEFFELFNEQEYYECHEVLEDLWMETSGKERPYYQGLIQTATAFYHLRNGNLGGARKLFTTGLAYLEPYPDAYLGFDLGGYRTMCEGWLQRAEQKAHGKAVAISAEDFPTLTPPAS